MVSRNQSWNKKKLNEQDEYTSKHLERQTKTLRDMLLRPRLPSTSIPIYNCTKESSLEASTTTESPQATSTIEKSSKEASTTKQSSQETSTTKESSKETSTIKKSPQETSNTIERFPRNFYKFLEPYKNLLESLFSIVTIRIKTIAQTIYLLIVTKT